MSKLNLVARVKAAVDQKWLDEKTAFGLTPVIESECRTNIDKMLNGTGKKPTFHFAVKHPSKSYLLKDYAIIEELIAHSDYDPQEEEADGKVFINPANIQMTCIVNPNDPTKFKYMWKPLNAKTPAETVTP